jgi:hypothetical protein
MIGSTPSRGLIELLLDDPTEPPDDLDIITESSEQDSWSFGPQPPRPGGQDTETKADGERDKWMMDADPRPGDTETKDDGEQDRWILGPDPRPGDLDTETAAQESDGWLAPAHRLAASDPNPDPDPEPQPDPEPRPGDIMTFTDTETDSWR